METKKSHGVFCKEAEWSPCSLTVQKLKNPEDGLENDVVASNSVTYPSERSKKWLSKEKIAEVLNINRNCVWEDEPGECPSNHRIQIACFFSYKDSCDQKQKIIEIKIVFLKNYL